MRRLREKIGSHRIVTRRGQGYVFDDGADDARWRRPATRARRPEPAR